MHVGASHVAVDTPREDGGFPRTWLRETLLLLPALIVATVVMTWPMTPRFFSELPGPAYKTDAPVYLWSFWWFQQHWREWFPNPFGNTQAMFYPLGTPLAYHTTVLFYAILGWPVALLLGFVPAYNAVCLFSFVACGVACYWLARYMGLRSGGAWVAAFLFAFSPFRLHRLTQHLCFMQGDLFALYILGLMALVRSERIQWWPGVLCGVTAALAFFTDPTSALYTTLVSLTFLAFFLRPLRAGTRSLHILAGLGLATLIATVLCLPALVEIARAHEAGDFYVAEGHQKYAADLIGFVTAPKGSILWDALRGGGPWYPCKQEGIVFLGALAMLLFAVGLPARSGDRRAWFLKALAVIFFVLSLGPTLKLFGKQVLVNPGGETPSPIRLPFALLRHLPLLGNARAPDRMQEVTTLAFALVAGIGLDALLQERLRKRVWIPVVAVVLVLCLAEYAVSPVPTFKPAWAAFDVVRQDRESGVVLDGVVNGREPIVHQVRHHRPIITGHVGRIPPECFGYIHSTPLLCQFATQGTTEAIVQLHLDKLGSALMSRNVISFLDIRYFVINGEEEAFKRKLFDGVVPYRLVAQDEDVDVYRLDVPEVSGLCPERVTVGVGEWSVYLGHGWGQHLRISEFQGQRKAIWPTSPKATVLFRVDVPQPVRVEFDTFLPPSCKGTRMAVSINEREIGTIDVPTRTNTVEIGTSADQIRAGMNEIAFSWPYEHGEYTWGPGGARVSPRLVLSSGATGRRLTFGSLAIQGQQKYKNKAGYNILELSDNAKRVLKSEHFDPNEDPDAWTKMVRYIGGIPEGRLVAFMSAVEASTGLTAEGVAALGTLGSAFDMRGKPFWCHAGLGRKGMAPGEALETFSGESHVSLAPGRCAFVAFRFKSGLE